MDNSQNHIGYFHQMPVTDKHLSVELNSDFSLPDYQPEIRRLLSTRVNIIPPSEYADNGGASFEGTVNYKILYLGADGKLYSTSLSDKYSFSIPIDFNSHSIFAGGKSVQVCANASNAQNTCIIGNHRNAASHCSRDLLINE